MAQRDIEQRVVAFAEQLGWLVGAAQAKTEGWLEQAQMRDQLTRIRDAASDLLKQLPKLPSTESKPPSTAKKTASAAAPVTVDAVHAPGKRHRKPVPSRRGVKHSNQQVAKAKMGSMRRTRGSR
ncbi:MAG TPA: hypothetical protein VFA59_07800 [Vicinamibacterales bacterium]|nr:hypothetical protein [Vicinamibacterales bacterium]